VCLERDRAEQAEADARGWADSFKQAEAALDSFLGPDGGKTVVELRTTIERLRSSRGVEMVEAAYQCEDCGITRRISELTSGCPICGETMVPAAGLPVG